MEEGKSWRNEAREQGGQVSGQDLGMKLSSCSLYRIIHKVTKSVHSHKALSEGSAAPTVTLRRTERRAFPSGSTPVDTRPDQV